MKRKKGSLGKSIRMSDSDYSWPDEETLAHVRLITDDPEYDGGGFTLPPSNASAVERAKYQICQMILGYKLDHDLLQKDIAEKIGADESRASEILRMRTASFTLDRLIGYAEKLMPKLRIHMSSK
jgi:predicted XRE-type DNA-binding protein